MFCVTDNIRYDQTQTDHVELMKKIEQTIAAIHAGSCVSVPREASATKSALADADLDASASNSVEVGGAAMPPPPFALIDEVADGSPAQEAGIAIGDQICCFAGIDRRETGDLNACFAAIQQLVPRSAGTTLEVIVLRGRPPVRVNIQLTPKQWQGRGLLGCHMAPKTD